MVKKLLIVIFVLISLQLAPPYMAEACTGSNHFDIENLPEMDLLVKATVVDADDVGHNAVLRIEEYYKGEAGPLLTVMRYPPALTSGALVRGYDTGCLYSGWGHRWVKGDQAYFGLIARDNGTFTDQYYGGTAHFYPLDGMIYHQLTYTEARFPRYETSYEDIGEEDFVDLMLELGNRDAPLEPTTDTPLFYPLMRFLNITTENGTRYQINPDRSVSQLSDDYPIAVSPDGAHVAFRGDDGTVILQYIWTDFEDYASSFAEESQHPVSGQAVRFSNDSNFVAIWDADSLSIYMFHNQGMTGYGQAFNVEEVATVDVESQDGALATVLWSADATTLAWQDATGIWRWNIFQQATPQQLLTTDELGDGDNLENISTYGRYLQVGDEIHWQLLDSHTFEVYEDTFVSPNEQYLIAIKVSPDDPSLDCEPPLHETCTLEVNQAVGRNTFSYRGNLIGGLACSEEQDSCVAQVFSWQPSMQESHFNGGRYLTDIVSGLRQVVYDAQNDQPALLIGEYEIHFDFYDRYDFADEANLPYMDIVDLEGIVDSPVASIEWGQPVFFSEYNIATFQFIPE